MISQLISALRSAEVEVTPTEVAEILWLAAHRSQSGSGRRDPSPPEVSPQDEPWREPGQDTAGDEPETAGSENEPTEPATVGDRPLSLPSGPGGGSGGVGGSAFRSPGASALPGSLALARSLRPLMRRRASRRRKTLDERATAELIAEQGIWSPVLVPASERWLGLELIVEESPSMRVWEPTIDAVARLFRRLGAFRSVNVWRLRVANEERPRLAAGRRSPPRNPGELLDPEGRKLILVLTDCVAREWYGGPLEDLFGLWGRSQPSALVQLLPQRMWRQTGLATARHLRAWSSRPGSPNSQLSFSPLLRLRRGDRLEGTPLPVVTLKPDLLSRWARALAGDGSSRIPAVLLRSTAYSQSVAATDEPSPEQRVQAFRGKASPLAFQLACLFAATPLRLPVMRLVQRTLLPESRQVHLAEVFLGGLMRRVGPSDPEFPPDQIDYDFLPGVRDLLLAAGSITDTVQVQRELSGYIAENYGSTLDFQAILEDPDAVGEFQIDERNRSFALVTAEVLKRLGPRYAVAVERLSAEDSAESAAPGSTAVRPSRASDPKAEPAGSLYEVLTHLNRLANSLSKAEGEKWLREILEADLEEIAMAALEVGAESGDPIGRVLGEVLERAEDLELARELELRLEEERYRESVPLRELALVAGQLVLRDLRGRPEAEDVAKDLARVLHNHGRRLGDLGRHEEALAALTESVSQFRRLAESDSDEFLPALAIALDTLGSQLSEMGSRREALEPTLEAAAIRRRLAEEEPSLHLADYLTSLAHLGVRYRELGRRRLAYENASLAAEMWRRLGEDQPEAAWPDLALALTNLGSDFYDLGRAKEALATISEAVDLYRRLSQGQPDAFLPKLGASLTNLGVIARASGRLERAVQASSEAVEIRRRLAALRPEAFLPDLASSLNNLSNALAEAGEPREALKTTQEALELYDSLAENAPAAFRHHRAGCLQNLALRLADLARSEEALDAIRRAAEEFRRLAVAEPERFRPILADALSNLGIQLQRIGRFGEAVVATREAVAILRELAEDEAAAFLPQLADALGNLSQQLRENGEPEEALAASEEAVEHLRTLVETEPDAHVLGLAAALVNHAAALLELERAAEAVEASVEAVALHRRMVAERSEAYRGALASSLVNLGLAHHQAGESAEGVAALEEAVAHHRHLEAALPGSHRLELATSLADLGLVLEDGGREEEALAAAREALELRREAAAEAPQEALPDVAASLHNLAWKLHRAGRIEDAFAKVEEAVRTLSPFFFDHPEAHDRTMRRMMKTYLEVAQAASRDLDADLAKPIIRRQIELAIARGEVDKPEGDGS